jgi:ankyrin repeat protein
VVDQASINGTALAQASLAGHLEVVDFLLSAGADTNHLTIRGQSPLYGAAQEGHIKIVKLLVKTTSIRHQMEERLLFSLQLLRVIRRLWIT